MSQEQLAEAADVSRATIIQIEAAEGDPRLSTLAGVASALGVSPVLLLLGRDELDAIANAPGSSEAERLKDNLSSDELDTMRRLLDSGIAKNRTKAVAIAASAATAAGLTAGTLASAAIGTAILPGIGTAIGVALGVWMTRKRASDLKLLTTTTDEPPATQKPS
jgi:transcriptional regulator with XRE-family HTH domain